MKRKLLLFVLLFFSFIQIATSATGVSKEIIIERIKKFLKSATSFKGDFILTTNGNVERGIFFYKSPNRFKMVFNPELKPDKQKTIVSNGKNLWVYIPHMKVVIDQDITSASENLAFSDAGLGIQRLIKKFKYDFYNNDNSLKNDQSINQSVRILRLSEPTTFSSFKEILLYITENGFIVKSKATTNDNKVIELIRTNYK